MYPTDQSISSYSSNPSTPVNSPPPLTSQQQQQQHIVGHPHPALHNVNSSNASISGGPPLPPTGGAPTWQQLTPVVNGGGGASSASSINAIQAAAAGIASGSYNPELVQRGLQHLVSNRTCYMGSGCDLGGVYFCMGFLGLLELFDGFIFHNKTTTAIEWI